MFITIDLNSEIPIYKQIRNQVIEEILKKNLKGGEPLCSVRQIAADLGINIRTALKAYDLLKQEGFIQVHRQRGAVVNYPEKYKANGEYNKKLLMAIRPIIIESMCRGLAKKEFLEKCESIYNGFPIAIKGD